MKKNNRMLSDDGVRAVRLKGKRVITEYRRSTGQSYTWRLVYPVIVRDQYEAEQVEAAWLERAVILHNPQPKPRLVWWQWWPAMRKA